MIDEKILKTLCDKVEETTDDSWEDIKQQIGFMGSKDTLRKSWSAAPYGGYYIYQYLKDKNLGSSTADEIARLQKAQDDEYKERCRLQDQNREKRKMLREEARFEYLCDVLRDEIQNMAPIVLNPYKPAEKADKVYATAMWSDWHCGDTANNPWNLYNIEVMKQRAETLVNKTIDKIKLHGVTHLVIEINGDMLDGVINVSSRVSQEADVVKQIVVLSEVVAQCVNKIKPYVEDLRIVTTLGNHGRLGSNKRDWNVCENFEMLIPEFLKLRLDMPIQSADGLDFTSYTIDDKFVCVAHGQYDKLSTVIADYAKMYHQTPDEVHIGHQHRYLDLDDCDINVTVNGSLIGSADYSLQCRKTTRPYQVLVVYGEDRCVYKLSL